MPFIYENGLIFLSAGVAIFGAFTALVMTVGAGAPGAGSVGLRVAVAALAIGLSAWAMQLIGFLAIKFPPPIRVGYDPALTLAAAGLAIAAVYGALLLMRSRGESAAGFAAAALAMGAGFAGMHHLGAISIEGAVKPQISALSIAVASGLALLSAMVILSLAFMRRGVIVTFAGAAAAGAALTAMHYGAMHVTPFRASGSFAGYAVPEFSEALLAWTAAVLVYILCSVCLAVFALVQFVRDVK